MRLNALKPHLGTLSVLALGLFFSITSLTTLDLGTLRRLGPGAFPLLVSMAVIVFSILILSKEIINHASWKSPNFKSALFVSMGLSAFALLTPLLGVIPATIISVLVSGSANGSVSIRSKVILAVIVSLGVWLIFVVGLKMPFTLVRGI